jgi:hypothetical protein
MRKCKSSRKARSLIMFSVAELSKLRFGMSDLPKPGGAPGDYEEKLTQWFLERSFFRDFTYRNPRGKKKGDELADAVVLFEDVGLLVQVKAQHGNRESEAWATEATLKALKQVQTTHDNLKSGAIKKLKNDIYGNVEFDPASYPNLYGVIILAHVSPPYDVQVLVPEIAQANFPIHVFSLEDVAILTRRFDTAGDFVNFIELRTDIRKSTGTQFLINNEENNLGRMISHVRPLYAQHMQPITEEILEKTVEAFRKSATGELLSSSEWKYGLAIDDMIARAHDQDSNLPWNAKQTSAPSEIGRFLGWLTRDRRIKLGKRLIEKCELAAKDGELHYFSHFQESRGTASVYLVSNLSRPKRVDCLRFLVSYAHFKYGVQQSFGVATEPTGGGRSYDFMLTRKQLTPQAIQYFKSIEDPFGDGASL